MIHIDSASAGDIEARLCDKNETVAIDMEGCGMTVYLNPCQAWVLLVGLHGALAEIDLRYDLGSNEMKTRYAEIEKWRNEMKSNPQPAK